MDITDNNNTNEKNKNGCLSPDPDHHTLYSQGAVLCSSVPPSPFPLHVPPQTRESANGRDVTQGAKICLTSTSTLRVS